jgi:uncharacterized membrane protein
VSLRMAHTVLLGVAAVFCVVTGVWAFGLTKSNGVTSILLGVGCVIVFFAVILQFNRYLGRTKGTSWL